VRLAMNSVADIYTYLYQEFGHDERFFFTFVSTIVNSGTFWGLNLLLFFVDRYNLLAKYKINPNQWADPKLVKKATIKLLFGHIFINPAVEYYVLYPAHQYFGMQSDPSSIPSAFTIAWHFLAYMLILDSLFYWAHRMLHHRRIYKYIHKQHHEFFISNGIATEYAHPVEEIVANAFPTVIGPILFGAHVYEYQLWLIFRLWETVDAHSGYHVPWSPWRILPSIQGGPDRHDFHHSHNVGNYGAFFVFWDRLCGTDKAYIEWQKKQQAQKQN